MVRIHDVTRDTDYELDADGEADGRDRTTWHQLELKVFHDLLRRDARFLPTRPRGRRCSPTSRPPLSTAMILAVSRSRCATRGRSC